MADLAHINCAMCGTEFGVEPEVEYYLRLAAVSFYCPLGHGNVFTRPKVGTAPKKRERQSATVLKLVPPDDAA